MAIIEGANSVYRGQEGSGQAYILPRNQAIGVYQAGIADANERERLRQAALLKRQQEISDANAKEIGDLKIGSHWGARANELQRDFDALNAYALTASQNGKSINTDRDFLQKRNQLLAKAAATKDLQTAYERDAALVGKEPDRFENGIPVLQSYQNASIDDFMSGKFKPQELKRIYSTADAIKDSNGQISYVKRNDGTYDTTKVNRSGNVGQAISSLNTPAAKYLIEKSGGDTGAYIGGFPTRTQDGKTYFNTEGKKFEDAVINSLATDPNFPAYLQQKGYDVSNVDAIRRSAFDFAKKQNIAAGKFVKDYADTLENRATTDITRTFAAEQNQRARNAEARAIENHNHDKSKWANEALAANPDSIVSNVITNVSVPKLGVQGKELRPSTSFAASNVGNSKTPFLPLSTFNPDTGEQTKNASPINISGGQVHIKPVLNFNGNETILDDKMLRLMKEGKLIIKGKKVPKNANVQYDELLYGEEKVPADPSDILSKATSRKLIVPVTGQALDKKFDKAYDRVKMWQTAIQSMPDDSDKMRAALQIVRQYNKGQNFSEAELKSQAAAYLNSIQ